MAIAIITLEQAKEHLRPPGDIDDDRITRMMDEASAIVLDYIKLDYSAYKDTNGDLIEEDVPPPVRAATLLVLGVLYDNADGSVDPLSAAAKSLLHTRRVPTLA